MRRYRSASIAARRRDRSAIDSATAAASPDRLGSGRQHPRASSADSAPSTGCWSVRTLDAGLAVMQAWLLAGSIAPHAFGSMARSPLSVTGSATSGYGNDADTTDQGASPVPRT